MHICLNPSLEPQFKWMSYFLFLVIGLFVDQFIRFFYQSFAERIDWPINPKGNQSWLFIGRTDIEAKTPILWPPYAKNYLIGKDIDAGKYWKWEEKRMTEDEIVGWHHRLNGHEFEQAPGVGDGQGSLTCCNPWGLKEPGMTMWLKWTELNFPWTSVHMNELFFVPSPSHRFICWPILSGFIHLLYF